MKERNKAKKVKDTLLIVYWTSGRGDIPNAEEDSATCTCKFSTSSLVLKSLPTLRFSYVICISSFIFQHFLRIKKKNVLKVAGFTVKWKEEFPFPFLRKVTTGDCSRVIWLLSGSFSTHACSHSKDGYRFLSGGFSSDFKCRIWAQRVGIFHSGLPNLIQCVVFK